VLGGENLTDKYVCHRLFPLADFDSPRRQFMPSAPLLLDAVATDSPIRPASAIADGRAFSSGVTLLDFKLRRTHETLIHTVNKLW
jgi:hypothetical protein